MNTARAISKMEAKNGQKPLRATIFKAVATKFKPVREYFNGSATQLVGTA